MNRELPPLPPPENEADTDGCTYACPEGFSEQQMTAYAAQAVAAERERCAVAAWIYYMDTCMKRGLPASMADEWCASRAIRGVES